MNRPVLGVPVRFLALTWDAGWEFDAPAVLLEPCIRYSPNGDGVDGIIEEAQLEIAAALETEAELRDEDVSQELDWRGWKLPYLRRVARESLAGKQFPERGYTAAETWARFDRQANGEVEIVAVSAPESGGGDQ